MVLDTIETLFAGLRTIVVDEVHAFATGKRGDLLSLCMARLQRFAPDLRRVPTDQEGDDLFKERMQKGAQRNGMTLMPVFNGLLPQETLWAVRAFMVSKHTED